MGTFFVYIVKTAFCLSLFYLFYKLLLSRDTFYRFNRCMVLALMLCSLLLPFVELSTDHSTQINQSFLAVEDLILMQQTTALQTADEPSPVGFLFVGAVCVYFVGVVFFLSRYGWSLYQIISLIRSGRVVKEKDGIKVVVHQKSTPPFSWMNYIVLSQQVYANNGWAVVVHEQAHVRNHHSLDVLLADIFVFLQWFNPAAWLLKNELQNIHEYEADEAVLQSGVNARTYQLLLIEKAVGPRLFSIANNFNHSSLKNRITMMKKTKSSSWARLKYLYVLPVAALAVTAFARPEVTEKLNRFSEVKVTDLAPVVEAEISKMNQPLVADVVGSTDEKANPFVLHIVVNDEQGEPVAGAAILIEGSNKGTVTDKNGKAKLEVKTGDVLKASCEEIGATFASVTANMKDKALTMVLQSDPIFHVVEVMPEFPGGMSELMAFLAKNIQYPEAAKKDNIQGRVIAQFVVRKDGSISDVKVVRSVDPLLDAEAIRVIKTMPKWKPGTQRGQAVNCKYTVPVTFQTQSNDNKIAFGSKPGDEPMVLVDGKLIDSSELSKIDPSTIESIEVMKDEENKKKYVEQYGEKTKNGIILVKMKK